MIPAFGARLLGRGKRLRGFAATARQARQVFAIAVAGTIFGSSTLLACPVCFGAEETTMVAGTKLGVVVLLTITLAVQGGFVGFFFYLRKRAKRITDVDIDTEWSEMQRATRTS